MNGLKNNEALSKGNIIIEDDVWIGQGAIILSGVTIGRGSVIGAGAVVAKDIPPYSIVVGNPGKVIKKRFSDEIIEKLMKVDYSKLDENKIKYNIDLLYTEINENNVDEIINMINGE